MIKNQCEASLASLRFLIWVCVRVERSTCCFFVSTGCFNLKGEREKLHIFFIGKWPTPLKRRIRITARKMRQFLAQQSRNIQNQDWRSGYCVSLIWQWYSAQGLETSRLKSHPKGNDDIVFSVDWFHKWIVAIEMKLPISTYYQSLNH